MNKRPILNLPPTPAETIVQVATGFTLLAAWGTAIWLYKDLPDTIAVHFDASGNPNGYGNKNMIFVMPGISTIIAIILALLSTIPHQFNYLATITVDNAERQYRGGRMLLFVLSLGIAAVAVWAVWEMAHS